MAKKKSNTMTKVYYRVVVYAPEALNPGANFNTLEEAVAYRKSELRSGCKTVWLWKMTGELIAGGKP